MSIRIQRLTAIAVMALLAGCQSVSEENAAPEAGQLAISPHGMVATAQPEATRAARAVLDKGGNAADAAITAAFVLAVVEPTMSGIGGRSQILVRSDAGDYALYNGMTEIPAAYARPEDPPADGYGTIATPGVVAALGRLHEEHGSLPMAQLIQPSIDLAENGFVLLPGEAARHADKLNAMQASAGFRQALLKADGSAYLAGEIVRQPQLANTLRRLRDQGLEDFYQGDLAAGIASDMAANGGYVTAQDLLSYQVLDGRYVSTAYRDLEIHSIAAPAGGGLVVKTLNILENFDLASMTDAQWGAVVNQALALAIETMKDDYEESDLTLVQSKAWASGMAQGIVVPEANALEESDSDTVNSTPNLSFSADLALAVHDWSGASWGADSHHTTHFVTSDCAGALVSITQTIGPVFGSKVISEDLGFVYASTMGSYLSGSAQQPGSRPRTTIAPTVLTRNGEPVVVLGAAGGLRILSAIVQTISRYVDRDMSLDMAVAAPRVHPQSETDAETGLRHSQGLKFHAETSPGVGWGESDLRSWQSAGLSVKTNPKTGAFGRVHAIERTAAGWRGVADPDWEGTAEGSEPGQCRIGSVR